MSKILRLLFFLVDFFEIFEICGIWPENQYISNERQLGVIHNF